MMSVFCTYISMLQTVDSAIATVRPLSRASSLSLAKEKVEALAGETVSADVTEAGSTEKVRDGS